MEGAVSTEAAARISADASLNTKINNVLSNIDPAALDSLTEIVSAFQSVDGDLEASILAVLEEHNNELSIEVDNRVSADASVIVVANGYTDDAVSAEAELRATADLSLETALATEVSDRENAISTEHAHHVSGDASVKLFASENISTEAAARISGDASLTLALSTETSLRAAGDVTLSQNLSTEVAARISGDASAALALSIEIDNRMAADFMAEEVVTSIGGGTTVNTVNAFYGGTQDLEVYVNGLRVEFTQNGTQEFDLNLAYDLEETDKVLFIGVAIQ